MKRTLIAALLILGASIQTASAAPLRLIWESVVQTGPKAGCEHSVYGSSNPQDTQIECITCGAEEGPAETNPGISLCTTLPPPPTHP